MARKSRKVDFVNTGSVADNTISTMQESRMETKAPVFRAGLYARLSLESEANRERNTVETQMELLKKFVNQTTDIVVEKEYFDISKTGTDAIYHRKHKDGCRNKGTADNRGCDRNVSGNH